jgi:hypothetical protein
MKTSHVVLLGLLFVPQTLNAQDCFLFRDDVFTNDFYFTASSDQGAVGDVVAVDVSLTVEEFHGYWTGIGLSGSYNSTKGELLTDPQYSEAFDSIAIASLFSIGGIYGPDSFIIGVPLRSELAKQYFSNKQTVHLITLFFRLKGQPGDSFQVDLSKNIPYLRTVVPLVGPIMVFLNRRDPFTVPSDQPLLMEEILLKSTSTIA